MHELLQRYSKYYTLIAIIFSLVTAVLIIFLFFRNSVVSQEMAVINSKLENVEAQQATVLEALPDALFADHLRSIENIELKSQLTEIQNELEALKNTEEGSVNSQINEIYETYQSYEKKLGRNTNLELDTTTAVEGVDSWGKYLLNQNFDELSALIISAISALDSEYDEYLASLPPPSTAVGGGYSYVSANTEKGTFGVYLIKFPKNEVTVKTIAAIKDDCSDNCATKSLQQYISENGAYAGMAGSYACPADYAQCSGKIWSFDFALYDSNDNKWLNKDALSWFETGMMTFTGNSSKFYEETSDYGGGYVTAAVSNFPSLLEDGEIKVDTGDIDSYQSVMGLRGAIGVDDSNIYLAYITGASVIDAAYAMRSLGATDALNLDGGGTAAMFINGSYVVGPGRPLANAVIIIK